MFILFVITGQMPKYIPHLAPHQQFHQQPMPPAFVPHPEGLEFYPPHHPVDPVARFMTPLITPTGEIFVPPQFIGVHPHFFPGFRPFRYPLFFFILTKSKVEHTNKG